MKHLGIEVPVKNVPELDPGFLPLGKFCTAFLKDAKKPLDIAVERAGGEVAVYKTFIHGTPDMAEADIYYVDRIIKMLLWMKGGFKVYLSGDQAVYEAMKATYRVGGARAFDADFMSNVYEKPFEVVYCDQVPAEKSNPQAVGRHLGGCRIGFDAGGSDRKVSAVMTASRSSPRRSSGSPRPPPTPTTTMRASSPPSRPPPSTCPGWTRWASPPPASISRTAPWWLPCSSRCPRRTLTPR